MAQLSAGGVAVVTGGASGLGFGTARALAARGARIALIDIDAQAVQTAAGSLDGDAIGLAADIRDPTAVAAAVDEIVERFEAIDVLVAGAGIVGWGPALMIERTDWERTIETNVLGTWRTVHAALPHLVRSKGYLLVVASGFAASPGPAVSAYAASKAAVESLGRSLRIELAHHGVDVGIAYYTFLDTPMVDAIEGNPAAMRARAPMPAPVRRTYPLDKAVEKNRRRHRAPRTPHHLPGLPPVGVTPARLLRPAKRPSGDQSHARGRAARTRSAAAIGARDIGSQSPRRCFSCASASQHSR